MPGSSLIFAIILAVWGAYLLQHWIRRRDHVATARSVDRFSEAMRVLERRRHRPVADRLPPRSYAASPVRPAHPDVLVKRAAPLGRGGSTGPGAGTLRRPARVRPARGPAVSPARGPAAAAPRRSEAPPRSGRTASLSPVARLAVLVAGLVAAGTGVVLSVVGGPWWLSLAGVGALVLALAVVRASVRRGRARTAATPRRRRPAAATQASRPAAAPGRTRPAMAGERTRPAPERRHTHQGRPSTPGDRPRVPRPAAAPAARADAHRPAARRVSVFDVDATEAATRSAAPAPTTPQDRADDSRTAAPSAAAGSGVATATGHPGVATSGTWEPVPVPPPTYTLKARASRPSASQLPADGREMALDVELEDLPPVRALG